MTEYGSVASQNSHLSGSSHVPGSEVVQEFCIKKADADDEDDDDAKPKKIHFMEGKTYIGCVCITYSMWSH